MGLAAAAALVAPFLVTPLARAESPAASSKPASLQQPGPAGRARTLNFDVQAALHAPLDLSSPDESSSSSSFSSSSASSLLGEAAAATDASALLAAPAADPGGYGNMQPPPRRRRYGRPNYNDRFHNSDGSSRLAFAAGGGFNAPIGSASSDYLNTGYRFQVGGGINLNKKLGVLLQFDYDHFGLPGKILSNQVNVYNNVGFTDANNNPVDFSGLAGNAHIWSFTLNPTFHLYQGDKWGAYAVAGGGFYHKVTNFTLPTLATGFDYFYGQYQYTVNQNIDTYTSNAPGVTGGGGVTYKFSRFANQSFFAEARFVHTFNQARAGDPTYSGAGTPYNLYPPNSNETSYIPITFGIRF